MSNGACLCGAVQFEVRGELPNIYQCHCSLCRRQSGGASNAATIVVVERFTWKTDLSPIQMWQDNTCISSHFCRECGSPVPNVLSADSSLMWVPVGLMDGVESRVVAHVCCDSKAGWDDTIKAGVKCYAALPSDLQAFVDFLSQNRD